MKQKIKSLSVYARTCLLFLPFLFFIILSPPIWAQEQINQKAVDPDLSTDQAELEKLQNTIHNVSKKATKSRLNADYVPGMVTILYGDDLAANGIRTKAHLFLKSLSLAHLSKVSLLLTQIHDHNKIHNKVHNKVHSKNQISLVDIYRELENNINNLLLLKERNTQTPYFSTIILEADETLLKIPKNKFSLNFDNNNKISRSIKIPFYATVSKELLAIANITMDSRYLNYYIKDVKQTYIIGACVLFSLLVLTGVILWGLIYKIQKFETQMDVQKAQVIHAGRLSAMGEMATGIAHELNQPLAIIRIAIDGIKKYLQTHANLSMEAMAAQKIVQQIERATTIINNMRGFVSQMDKLAEPIDIRESITRALSFFNEQFRMHEIHMETQLPETHVMVLINSQKFEQIIVNLLSNARYAVEKKAEASTNQDYQKIIAISLHRDNPNLFAVKISDNGMGMPPEIIERCREPFFSTKNVGEGTGLGLSIINSIIKENKLELTIASQENIGTTFIIKGETLPPIKEEDINPMD